MRGGSGDRRYKGTFSAKVSGGKAVGGTLVLGESCVCEKREATCQI